MRNSMLADSIWVAGSEVATDVPPPRFGQREPDTRASIHAQKVIARS
jgi:hypothetical protein